MREAAAVALEFIESAEMRTHLEKEGDALSIRTWLGVVAGAPAALKKKLAALERIARAQGEPEARRLARAYRQAAAQALAARLCEKGMTSVAVYDVSNTHVSQLIAETFRFSHIVLASVTYNMEIYPVMHSYLNDMKGLNVQNRTVAIIENGTWACKSGELMGRFVQEELKGMKVLENRLTLCSTLKEEQADSLDALADSLIASVQEG